MKEVILVTDGACKKNPGPGGWACLLRCNGKERTLHGGTLDTTNNRMELQAVIEGLKALKEPVRVKVITDSQYITKTFEEGRLKKWQRNGWKTNTGAVKNQDLWEQLAALVAKHKVEWSWIKGHTGDPDHDRVDALASEHAEIFKKQIAAID